MGILVWGVVPPILLLIYIYWVDKVEKEPPALVAKALVFGCLSVIPTLVLEIIGDGIVTALLGDGIVYMFVYYFFVVALSEEFCKRTAMKLAVWKNPEFNYVFDAILYCVAAALGFALVENVEYMLVYGTGIALGRLIPVHTICGVFMGVYLGMSKKAEAMGDAAQAKRCAILSLVIPVAIHGFWDFSVSVEVSFMALLALVAIVALTAIAFYQVHNVAKNDQPFNTGFAAGAQAPMPFQGQPAQQMPGMQQPAGVQAAPPYPTQGAMPQQAQQPQRAYQAQGAYPNQGVASQQQAYRAPQQFGAYPAQAPRQGGAYPSQPGMQQGVNPGQPGVQQSVAYPNQTRVQQGAYAQPQQYRQPQQYQQPQQYGAMPPAQQGGAPVGQNRVPTGQQRADAAPVSPAESVAPSMPEAPAEPNVPQPPKSPYENQ